MVILILVPFTLNNFLQGRLVLGVATFSVGIVCAVNVWNSLQGRYSLLVNTYLVTPTSAFTITYSMYQLGPPASYWPFLLVLAYYFVLPEKRAWFFNALTVLIIVPMAWVAMDLSAAVRFSAVLLGRQPVRLHLHSRNHTSARAAQTTGGDG